MQRTLSKLLILPALTLSACQLPPSAGLAPIEVPAPAVVPGSIVNQAEAETGAAIARGDATNALSGIIALPVTLRKLSSRPGGPLPVTLHVFRVTGQLVREARVSLFERDAQNVSFIVDGAPSDVPLVLAATIEPGMVLRALVPRSSAAQPARGQVVDARTEVIALRAYQAGLLPPVALGGAAEVVRQGGLVPSQAAEANRTAAAALRSLAASWPPAGRRLPPTPATPPAS